MSKMWKFGKYVSVRYFRIKLTNSGHFYLNYNWFALSWIDIIACNSCIFQIRISLISLYSINIFLLISFFFSFLVVPQLLLLELCYWFLLFLPFVHHHTSFTHHKKEALPLLIVRIMAIMTVIPPAIITCLENFVLFHEHNTFVFMNLFVTRWYFFFQDGNLPLDMW